MTHFLHFLINDALPFTGFLICFFLVIFIHEGGHYLFARLFGVRVLSFSVGSGWELFSKIDKAGTRWSFHIFPFVGGLTIAGQSKVFEDSEDSGSQSSDKDVPKEELFRTKPLWKQFLIIISGPLFNIALAFLFLFFLLWAVGEPAQRPVVTSVKIDGPADKSGFEPGDLITQINGTSITSFAQVRDMVQRAGESSLDITVSRNGQTYDLTVAPEKVSFKDVRNIKRDYAQIGILSQVSPMDLRSISEIEGTQTKRKIEKGRKLAINHLGETVTIKVKTTDGKFTLYKTRLHEEANRDLLSPGSLEHNNLFLGQYRDNVLKDYGLLGAGEQAMREVARLTSGIIKIPFNAIPFDNSLIKPPSTMTGYDYPVQYIFYKIFFLGAAMSLFLGLVNLLPVPGFDGARIISVISRLFPNSDKVEEYLQRSTLTLFILAVIFANSMRIGAL